MTIPVAVKLPPCFSGLALLAESMQEAGAGALVLFNRAPAPDLDPGTLASVPPLQLSRTTELPLRLRWLAILSCRLRIPLAATGGVHDEMAAIKALMAGARVVQMVSAILARGPRHLRDVRTALESWMGRHGYESVAEPARVDGPRGLPRRRDLRAGDRDPRPATLPGMRRVSWRRRPIGGRP